MAPPAPTALTAAPPLVRRAYDLAERAHRRQRRKDRQAFITYPVRVARLVAGCGYDEEVLAAALLHDVVEDTPVTLGQVRAAFGRRVAELVDCVTEDPTLPVAERKRCYTERVRRGPRAARAICAADKVCNAADLRAVAERGDAGALTRFYGGLEAQVQRLRGDLRMLDQAGADAALLAQLGAAVSALHAV